MSPLVRAFAGELCALGRGRRLALVALLFAATATSVGVYARQVLRELPVAVLDLDGSELSRRVRLFVEAAPEVATAEAGSLGALEADLAAGRIVAAVVIPAGFSAAVKRGRPAAVHVRLDMSNLLLGRTARKAIARAVGTVSAGVGVEVLQKLGERREAALGRAVPLRLDERPLGNPGTSYAVYLAPGLAFSFLHVFLLILAGSIRLPPGAARAPADVLGREAAVAAATLVLGVLFVGLFLVPAGIVPRGDPLPGLLLLAALIGADLLLVRAAFTAIPRALGAFQLTGILGLLSLPLSGITYPADAFPAPLRAVSELVPFTPFARGLRLHLHGPATVADLLPCLAHLAALGLLFAAVGGLAGAVRRLTRRQEVVA